MPLIVQKWYYAVSVILSLALPLSLFRGLRGWCGQMGFIRLNCHVVVTAQRATPQSQLFLHGHVETVLRWTSFSCLLGNTSAFLSAGSQGAQTPSCAGDPAVLRPRARACTVFPHVLWCIQTYRFLLWLVSNLCKLLGYQCLWASLLYVPACLSFFFRTAYSNSLLICHCVVIFSPLELKQSLAF